MNWKTQSANQAVGTGVLVGRRPDCWWLDYAADNAWFDIAAVHADQSARIGWGAR